MFARRNLVVDDDDNVTEATMMFNAKAKEDLRKMAPTAAEKATRPIVPGMPAMSSVKKKLTFDDTFTFDCPTLPASKSALAEKENEIEVLNRKILEFRNKNEQLDEVRQNLEDNVIRLKSDNSNLRKQIVELEEDLNVYKSCNTSILDKSQDEDWRNVATKYFIWFNAALEQLHASTDFMKTNKIWNSQIKQKLSEAGQLKLTDLTNDDLEELLSGSVQDYIGVHGLDEPDDVPMNETVCDDTIAFDCTQDSAPHSFMSKKSRIESLSPIKPETSILDQSSILNSTLYNTSIDFEKDEMIARLETEKNELSERLKLASCRAQKYLLVEEQKRSLEDRYKHLENQLKEALGELSAFKAAAANNIFELADGSTLERFNLVTERVKALQLRLTQTEEDLANVKQERDYYQHHFENMINENRLLNESVSQQKHRIEQNERFLREQRVLVEESSAVADNKQQMLDQLVSELQEAKERLAAQEIRISEFEQHQGGQISNETLTDAGDSTQIFHMARNPLQEAHDKMMEDRKRKAEDEMNETAKRFRDEEVEALKARLVKIENEKAQVSTTLSEFAKKYRTVVTVLSGYQFKVTDIDEGVCCVNSVYEGAENQFIFKYDSVTQQVDLLDAGQPSSWNSQGHVWEAEMKRYIGERQSVPAFLAAVTLALESRRELPEEVERNHTFSVLQHLS